MRKKVIAVIIAALVIAAGVFAWVNNRNNKEEAVSGSSEAEVETTETSGTEETGEETAEEEKTEEKEFEPVITEEDGEETEIVVPEDQGAGGF